MKQYNITVNYSGGVVKRGLVLANNEDEARAKALTLKGWGRAVNTKYHYWRIVEVNGYVNQEKGEKLGAAQKN